MSKKVDRRNGSGLIISKRQSTKGESMEIIELIAKIMICMNNNTMKVKWNKNNKQQYDEDDKQDNGDDMDKKGARKIIKQYDE